MNDVGPWFDPAWYLRRNPDVGQAGMDPLAHYSRYGEAEGRLPSRWFDPQWYRSVYALPAGQSALAHYLAHRGLLPCAALYPVPHLAPWRDAPDPIAAFVNDPPDPEREWLPNLGTIRASGAIDAAYTRINPLDRFEAALDPTLHYCRFGWRLGFRPSTVFDPRWYSDTNPDAARPGIDPLLHYILEGEAADRRPVPWFDPGWYRKAYAVPAAQLALAHYLAHRGSRGVSPNKLFDVGWYVARHGDTMPPEVDPFAHYLLYGAMADIDPSPRFDAGLWRHRAMGWADARAVPPEDRNPLVDYLRRSYLGAISGGYDGCAPGMMRA